MIIMKLSGREKSFRRRLSGVVFPIMPPGQEGNQFSHVPGKGALKNHLLSRRRMQKGQPAGMEGLAGHPFEESAQLLIGYFIDFPRVSIYPVSHDGMS